MDQHKTQKERLEFGRQMLQSMVHKTYSSQHNSDGFERLKHDLLSHHPTWKGRLDEIANIRVTRNRTAQKALTLKMQIFSSSKKKYSPWFKISWRDCCIQRTETIQAKLTKAMRFAIRRQISSWRRRQSKPFQCSQCQKELAKGMHVDHKEPKFSTLRDQFLANWVNCTPSDFQYASRCRLDFKPENNNFKQAWQQYHRQHATFQWLCPKCNIRKG